MAKSRTVPPPVTGELSACLERLAAGDDSCRGRIIEICDARLRKLAHRLLGRFAKVRRWDDTDDVAQNAAIRLHRALGDTVPDDPRGLMGLMATQIQRELLDLARKHAGPMSYASNHESNVRDATDGEVFVVDEALDVPDDDQELPIERWEEFHQAVANLPEELGEVFKLAWYLGLDQTEAARILRCSTKTVGRRWKEAQEQLARALDGAGGAASPESERSND